MIDGLRAVAAQPFDAPRIVNTQGQIGEGRRWAEQEVRVCPAGAPRYDRIAIHSLEEGIAFRANIADTQNNVLRHFARYFKTKLIGGGRTKIRTNRRLRNV
jgi:hypothetical protein